MRPPYLSQIEPGDNLAEAQAAATSLGEPGDDLGVARFAFGPTKPGFWTVSIELETASRARRSRREQHRARSFRWRAVRPRTRRM
jgi:hypothetical protein